MGYQLWVSPTTGYRRRGTSVADLTTLLEKGITVAAVCEPLRCCAPEDMAVEVHAELERLNFDVAGVFDRATKRVSAWISKADLVGRVCGEHARHFEPNQLVSDSASLAETMREMGEHERFFVVARRGVTGLITRADLRKPPARVALFAMISLLEMHIAYWVQQIHPHDSWRAALSQGRLEKVNELLARRQALNESISEVDCLQWCDRRTILSKDERARSVLNLGTRAEAEAALESIERLRDRLAHSQEDYAGPGGWPELATTIKTIESILLASEGMLGEELAAATVVPPKLDAAV